MASPATRAEYAQDAADFIADMREFGREASFGVRSTAGPAWNPSGEYVETGTAPVFPIDWRRDFSADVRSNDLFFFVGVEVDVENCTVMLDQGGEYSIECVKPFQPDDQVIFYEVQVRV